MKPSDTDVDISRLVYYLYSEANSPDPEAQYVGEFTRELNAATDGKPYIRKINIEHHGHTYTLTVAVRKDTK